MLVPPSQIQAYIRPLVSLVLCAFGHVRFWRPTLMFARFFSYFIKTFLFPDDGARSKADARVTMSTPKRSRPNEQELGTFFRARPFRKTLRAMAQRLRAGTRVSEQGAVLLQMMLEKRIAQLLLYAQEIAAHGGNKTVRGPMVELAEVVTSHRLRDRDRLNELMQQVRRPQ